MRKQSFIQGAFILSAAGFVTRIIGFINGIILARLLGAEGLGLLMMAYPLVPLIITITELGLPAAITKLVAEADAQGNAAKERKILAVSLSVTGTLSVALAAITLTFSETIASLLLTDQRAYYAMLAITPIAPIVAVSAVLKGYYRGKQHMQTIALTDCIEHTVHIVAIVGLVRLLLPYGLPYAAAGAMVASLIGEASGLLFLLAGFRLRRGQDQGRTKKRLASRFLDGKHTLLELMQIGLPTTGHGFIHSVYSAVQPMIVTGSLANAGIVTALATKQFGMLAGFVFPLLFMPGFITHSLSTALMPAISEANAQRNDRLLHRRIDQAMSIALLIGAPGTVILYVLATPLTSLIYHAPEAGSLLKLLAPVFFLHYFEGPLYAVLIGLGKASAAMWNVLIATVCKAAAIIILGSKLGIQGVALGIGIGIILLAMLHFLSVSSTIGSYLDARPFVKITICAGAMGIAAHYLFGYLESSGWPLIWCVVSSIAAALMVYFLMLAATKSVKRFT